MKPFLPILVFVILPLSACSDNGTPEKRYEKMKRERAERMTAGAQVQSDKQIAPGEHIRVLVIPDEPIESFRCVLYTNANTGASSMACPTYDFSSGTE